MSTDLETAALDFVRANEDLRAAKRMRNSQQCKSPIEASSPSDPAGHYGPDCWRRYNAGQIDGTEMCESCQKRQAAHRLVAQLMPVYAKARVRLRTLGLRILERPV